MRPPKTMGFGCSDGKSSSWFQVNHHHLGLHFSSAAPGIQCRYVSADTRIASSSPIRYNRSDMLITYSLALNVRDSTNLGTPVTLCAEHQVLNDVTISVL